MATYSVTWIGNKETKSNLARVVDYSCGVPNLVYKILMECGTN